MSTSSPTAPVKDVEIPVKEQLLEIPFHTYVVVEQILKKELEESEKNIDITDQQKISKNKAALVQKWVSRAITRVHAELQSRVAMFHNLSDNANLNDVDEKCSRSLAGNEKQNMLNSISDLSKELAVSKEHVQHKMEEELKNLENERNELMKAFEDSSKQKTEISKKLVDIKAQVIQEMQSSIISDVTENSKKKISYSPSKREDENNNTSLVPAKQESLVKQNDINNINKALIAVNEGHELFKRNLTETIQTVNALLEETPQRLTQYKETVESVKAFLSEKPSKLDQLMSHEIVVCGSEDDENIDTGNRTGDNKSKCSKRRLSEVSKGASDHTEEIDEDIATCDDHTSEVKKQKLQHEKIISCLEDHLAFQEEDLVDTTTNSDVGKPFDILY